MNKSFALTALLFLAGPTLITRGSNNDSDSSNDSGSSTDYSNYDSERLKDVLKQKNKRINKLEAANATRQRKRTVYREAQEKAQVIQAIHALAQEAANQELLKRFFSNSFSTSLGKIIHPSLCDGNDATALLTTVVIKARLIHLNSKHPNRIGKSMTTEAMEIAGDLATELTGKYLARKSVNVAIYATNWCYRKFSDKDLIDVVKYENAINLAKDFTGLVGSAASKPILIGIVDRMNNFASHDENGSAGDQADKR